MESLKSERKQTAGGSQAHLCFAITKVFAVLSLVQHIKVFFYEKVVGMFSFNFFMNL